MPDVTLAPATLNLEAVERLSQAKNEPEWMLRLRRNAWETFEQSSLPDWTRGIRGWWAGTLKEAILENLKPYVPASTRNLSQLPAAAKALLNSEVGDEGDDEANATGNQSQEDAGGLLVQYNSDVISTMLCAEAQAQGVILCSLDDAVQKYPELVQKYFMTRCVPTTENKFTALHGALWSGGIFLYIPKGTIVSQPIRAIFYVDDPEMAVFTHTLVIAEADSKVQLVQEYLSPNGETHSIDAGIVEIFAGKNARTEYYDQQEWGDNLSNFSVKRAMVGEYGLHKWVVATLGSGLTRLNLDSVLEGSGARAETTGFTFSAGDQHFDTRNITRHAVPHTTADSLFKAVLNGNSQVGFEGIIRADKIAQDTDSYLLANTLYLSEKCKADIQPGLDVWANEVRCSHGATIGMIDEEQVFYLQTRGIPVLEAQKLIVEGFFEAVIARVPLEGVRQRLRESIQRKMT